LIDKDFVVGILSVKLKAYEREDDLVKLVSSKD